MRRTQTLLAALAFLFDGNAQNEDARYNYIHHTIERHDDGSTDRNTQLSVTLLTQNAVRTYGQTYTVYNPDYQNVIINEGYTIQADGKKVPLPERAITDVLPSRAGKASDINQMLEKVVVHTGLEPGCTVYLDYTMHSKKGFNKHFDFTERYDQSSPITTLTYTISVPADMSLKISMCSPEGHVNACTDVTNGERRTIKYELDSLPAHSRDAYQTSDINRQYYFMCTSSDFQTEMTELFYQGIDPEIQQWADKVVKEEPDAMKRYNRICDYVRDEFATVDAPLSVTNGMRPMKDIIHGAYITPYERAALLSQMLNACNIGSDVVVEFPISLNREFRTLNNVKHYYVTQRYGEAEKTLDPSNKMAIVEPALSVGLNHEAIKPDTGKKIDKEYSLEVKVSDLGDKGYHVLVLPANNDGVAGWNMGTLPTLRVYPYVMPSPKKYAATYT